MSAATPTQNGLSATNVVSSGKPFIDALVSGLKWGGNLGTPISITYSFPGVSSKWAPPGNGAGQYGHSGAYEPDTGFAALTVPQSTAFELALQTWADVANINFVKVTETDSLVGDIRVAFSTAVPANSAAYGYFPHSISPAAGDIWLNPSPPENQDPQPGTYGFTTLIHELGHALGFSHPNNNPNDPAYTVQTTIMSYNRWPNSLFRSVQDDGNGGYNIKLYYVTTTTPSINDIAAIQYLYGANNNFNIGDDTYNFDPASPFYKTIWDAGGNDTISVTNFSEACWINLNPGQFSSIVVRSAPLPAGYSGGSKATYFGENNLGIAYGCVIENATGGSGADILIGNSAANVLTGGAGVDTLIGGKGDDTFVVNLVSSGSGANMTAKVEDTITEASGLNSGTDTLQLHSLDLGLAKAAAVTLSANIENLDASGTDVTFLNLMGNARNNLLTGNDTANVLDGAAGVDILIGGLGNDTYVVDLLKVAGAAVLQDTVIEEANGGTDTLQLRAVTSLVLLTATTFTVASNIENIDAHLSGTTKLNLTGDDLDNVLIGNAAANVLTAAAGNDTLNGLGGRDTLVGGNGDDTYVVDNANDVITETGADTADLIQASISIDLGLTKYVGIENVTLTGIDLLNATGDESDNHLTGNAAANVLDGSLGTDTLAGGKGDDTYLIDNTGDTVQENFNAGIDTVKVNISTPGLTYTLEANVENATLVSAVAYTLTGNDLANTLQGNDSNNTLYGGADSAADTLLGGKGDDTYIVDLVKAGTLAAPIAKLQDTVTELAGQGTDMLELHGTGLGLFKATTLKLGANLEKLDAHLTDDLLNFTGNGLNNTLIGNDADNVINGAGGGDTLTGNGGADTFVFDRLPATLLQADVITDFLPGEDQFALSKTIFTVLKFNTDGSLKDGQFAAADGQTTALDATTHLIYNKTTGDLYYDADANGAHGAVLLATLGNATHPVLAEADLHSFA